MRIEDFPALTTGLQAAVPLWIHEMRTWTEQRRVETGGEAGQYIACHGDELMYGGKKGAAAEAFNHLAKGLASLAYVPGGVTFAGQHWCVNHAECEAAEKAAELVS